MAGRRAPTAVVLAMVICGLVVAASLTGAAVLRVRAAPANATPGTTSETTTSTTAVTCRRDPCRLLGTATVGGTVVELIGDSGLVSGRVRIGSPGTQQVIEMTITDLGVYLDDQSLECAPGAVSACLVRGSGDKGTAGQVVVGRSDKWSAQGRAFFSEANYLSLANVDGDSAPEVIAVQLDCATGADCSKRPVYAQVFGLGGQELGCTRLYPRIDQLPGYPTILPTATQLRDCP
ncbi:hypothetical protein [Actinokineospora globicatena]|uniref:Uncharacterized protein n=1 Tax=Actinokineospora globicatena TaxID=103729 RepID=A0A9W6QSM9_9PSEU|nr:hypothetical protein [Actinokineospora globicatena]MCP2302056.1 hypothetical protein [Actinokineospora globicatena]GLW76282.1 hypothetical protein Aglo01_07640 [Actinokineospora globicatena]GLW83118.1 hypothetical protein Aglo02_07580 [Actinokineospora globicatena]GLW95396.1 hypothetical protein Aglo03_62120 [Actinokineospora globicatena]